MAGFNEILIAILLVLGAVLLVFSIIICIKLLYTVDKMNIILTDVETNQTTVYESDVAPVIHNERTMIPVRVISEILGYKVDWESQTRKVIISR